MAKANQDIRDYMADHCVTQRMLDDEVGVSVSVINRRLAEELCERDKEVYLNLIDSLAATGPILKPTSDSAEETDCDVSCSTKFQMGDRVKIPAKAETIGVITDIWSSLAQGRTMYEVAYESNGNKGLYAEDQLEPAPIPTSYSFDAHIDGNVAVVTMMAIQGEKTWVYSRGHAHILHDGEVGMAQAVSFAAKRMFESLDKQQENKIYLKDMN